MQTMQPFVQSLVQAGQLLYMTEIDGSEQPKTEAWMMKPLSAGCENTVVTSTPDLGHARFFFCFWSWLFVCLFIHLFVETKVKCIPGLGIYKSTKYRHLCIKAEKLESWAGPGNEASTQSKFHVSALCGGQFSLSFYV